MSEHTIELNKENFDKQTAKGKWVIDFWAAWCGPCKIIAPIIEELGKEQKGKIRFGKVDVDINQELGQRYEIMSIPTLLFIQDGEIVNRVVGAMDKEDFQAVIDKSF